jgi:hypothetical protein
LARRPSIELTGAALIAFVGGSISSWNRGQRNACFVDAETPAIIFEPRATSGEYS